VLLVATIAIGLALAIRDGGIGHPVETPTPAPSASPYFDDARLGSVIARWSEANGNPRVSVTLLGPRGELLTLGGPPGSPASADSTVRIGEVSRVFVDAAIVALDECHRGLGSITCPAPVRGGLSLDDPAARWVAAWPAGDDTTVRQLLEGSSGIAPIGASIADLRDRIIAAPGDDWSRRGLIARALAEPRRFPPGSRRSPADTELMILEDVIDAASGRPRGRFIDDVAGHGRGKLGFLPTLEEPQNLLEGVTRSGDRLPDLDAGLLGILGNQGAIAASSRDLAYLAINTWGSTTVHDGSTIAYLTDSAHGRQAPIGARSACPCAGDERSVILQTGDAVGWSALTSLDVDLSVTVGVVLDHDIDDAALEDLLQGLEAALRG
jgi:hypothetical protein